MKTDEHDVEYMYNFVETICDKFGPRYSCSEAEKKANLWIKDELDKFSDETFIDEFETHPGLYPIGIFKVMRVIGAISFIFMPLVFPGPLFSTICFLVGLLIFYFELFGMKHWIKIFFKKGTSSNVFGIIKPTREPKFRIVFEGHTDSAIQMKIASFIDKPPYLKIGLGIYFIPHTIICSLMKFIGQINSGPLATGVNWWIFSWTPIDWIYFIPFIILYPLFLWTIGGFLGKTVVLGANDNLSASAISVAVGKYLSKNRPRNVEVWIGSQGSEEVGDQGARYFVKKYGKEKGLLDNAYAVVLDACGAGSEIFLIHKDTMHHATYSIEIIDRLKKAHEMCKRENPNIIGLDSGRIPLGSSDACRYIHAGFKAATLIVRDAALKKPRYWHSVKDIPENLEKDVLHLILEICLNFVEIVDQEYD